MFRELGLDEGLEIREVGLGGVDFVDEGGERVGEPDRVLVAGGPEPGVGPDLPGEQKPAAHGIDRRRDVELRLAFAHRGHGELVLVDVADRPDRGKDQRASLRLAQERLAQMARRAAGRHQDERVGEPVGFAAVAVEHAGREGVDERCPGRDVEDAAHGCPASQRSAAARFAGVSTVNQPPRWGTPWSRPVAIALSHRRLKEKGASGASAKSLGWTIWTLA